MRSRPDHHYAPVPPGWPGDDPTLPEGGVAVADEPHGAGDRRQAGDDLVAVDDDLDLVAGAQPAGRALVVMVLALVLAMLVNADALVERAERKPPGPGRDRSLAIWHPVQDVSHALQLHRIRQLADRLAGDGGDHGDDREAAPLPSQHDTRRPGGAAPAEPAPPTTAAPDAAPEVRTPTEDDPLRVWIGGDSMAELFGRSVVSAAEATGVVDPVLHYEMASGLTRPDYYDWPAALAADVDEHDPEVVVLVVGANDGQGIVAEDGTPVPEVADPRWAPEYRRRVGALMDQLRADGRLVVWVGQPPMREPGYAARLAVVNQAFADEAATRPWVVYVDPAPVVGDPAGGYVERRPGVDGVEQAVRRDDGIHLTEAGGELLAHHVLGVIEEHVDLSGAKLRPWRPS